MQELPKMISVDDHVVEPPDLWSARLASKYREAGPKVRRIKAINQGMVRGGFIGAIEAPDDPTAVWVDQWVYEDRTMVLQTGQMQVHNLRELHYLSMCTYDDMPAGVWQQAGRLADMDLNHCEAALMFPTIPRFCGQTFLEAADKDVALACVRVYNDWMIDEWCAGPGYGRLIPMELIPLWDPDLAAAEVRRCAAKGSFAVSFSECPPWLGLPSIFGDHWHPLWRACEETDTVVNMHIGSSSKFGEPRGSDVPPFVGKSMSFQNSLLCMGDWLASGLLERFKTLKIVLSEGQVGWIPFVAGRFDNEWELKDLWERDLHDRVPNLPSSYIKDRIYGCIFDDLAGLRVRDQIGMSQIMWENDYPHGDTSFPHSRQMAEKLIQAAELSDEEAYALVRGNAIACYGLQRFGITS
jgi:predicted TIM-barrel fold metal-dependent hydrolase